MSVGDDESSAVNRGLFTRVNLVGDAPPFRRAIDQIARFAEIDATVLITGESGTGKELAARAIHYDGSRRDRPFIPINCATLSDGLIENELFGHEKGAYTHAVGSTRGLVEQASGGTLFLDEIDCLSNGSQSVLLRFLDNQDFRRLGDQSIRRADTRIIAAANEDLERLVSNRRFRKDLYYRLNVLKLTMPPLRKRRSDVPLLAQHFLQRFRSEYDSPDKHLTEQGLATLQHARWPGNVRELYNTVLRAFLLSTTDRIEIDAADLSGVDTQDLASATAGSLREQKKRVMAEFECRYLRDLMRQTHGNVTQAARLAGTERRAFGRLLKKHGIDRSSYDACNSGSAENRRQDSAFE